MARVDLVLLNRVLLVAILLAGLVAELLIIVGLLALLFSEHPFVPLAPITPVMPPASWGGV